jgi:hypothetical protein
MWRFLKAVWRVTWGLVELAVILYVLNAIKGRETSLIVSVLGLIYATIRVLALNLAHAFMLLARGLEQRLYELERHWDPQKQQPETDFSIGQFYWDAFISWVFVAMVYLICLLNLFSRL